jgi:PAS domain S-box-containing protein
MPSTDPLPTPLTSASPSAPASRSFHPTDALSAALELLCRTAFPDRPDLLVAVHLLDRGSSRWALVVHPDMPEGWRRLHRTPLGPEGGACAAAVSRRERTVVTDAGTDPIYGSDRFSARLAGVGACWATPIIAGPAPVRGVLLVHAPRGRRPDVGEAATLDRLAALAALLVDQHDQQEGLRRSQSRWRSFVERADLGVVEVSPSGRIVGANRAYARLLGQLEEDLRGREALELVHSDDREQVLDQLARLATGAVSEIRAEIRLLKRGGRAVWVRLTSALIQDAGSEPGSRMEFVQDISDRKRAETALARAREDLAAAERAGSTGRWILDIRTGLLLWSREMFRIWGLEPATRHPDLESALLRVHPDDVGAVRATLDRAVSEPQDIQGEHRIVRPDGTLAYVQFWGRPVLGQHGEILEYVGTVRDTTEEWRTRGLLQASLEERRALAARQLQARDEERRRIARELHETTVQQLVALRLNLGALERSGTLTGASEMAQLHESITLAERSMNDLRTLSYVLHPPLLDEAGLEPALRWYVRGFAKRSGLDVQLELPEELGRLSREVETALFRMVQECLTNTLRHAGSPAAAVRVRGSGGRVVVEVEDWGRGMDVRAGSGGLEGAMTGVGLAGMRDRIRQLGGRLEIESAGRGTLVRATVPADRTGL